MKRAVIRRKLARADRALEKAIDRAEIPGAVVLARMPHRAEGASAANASDTREAKDAKEEELIEYECVRGLALVQPERIPMQRDTIFDVASLTKPMATVTGVLLLAGEGRIDLDDPVAKHLPAFAERDKDKVTIRHLLTHSAGLRPWRGFHDLIRKRERKSGERILATAEARDWIVDRVVRSGLVHEPGAAAVYGDLDFIALGAMLEEITSQPLDEFTSERIFEPLGLADTRFHRLSAGGAVQAEVEPARLRRVAGTENCPWRDRIVWGEVHDPNAWAMGGVAGHAGVFSTADDVMRFALAWLDAWHGREGLLPTALVREFCRRQHMPEESDWALGWDTPTEGASSSGAHFSEQSIGHLGFTGTSVWIDLEREAVVVMLTNRVHLVAKRSRFALRPIVHDHVLDAFLSG